MKGKSPNQQTQFDISELGLAKLQSGPNVSDQNLNLLFSMAAEANGTVKFMRLGGPKIFRSQIIAFVDKKRKFTPGYEMLIDERISQIEFVLTNPYSETFFSRMDAEEKNNWEIWRVQEQVLEFARGLLRASQQREMLGLSKIVIAFHEASLIWNLGIANDQYVIVRPYYGSSTGHDQNLSDIHLETEKQSRLAESFINYYDHVKNDPNTRFVTSENELMSIGKPASLLKPNAVLNPSDTSKQHIEKACTTKLANQAEKIWIDKLPPNCTFFKPVPLNKQNPRIQPWRGQTLLINRLEGIKSSELLWHIQRLAIRHPDLTSKLEQFAGFVIHQSFRALNEFQSLHDESEEWLSNTRRYPWSQKLKEALLEAGKFIPVTPDELSSCLKEAQQLGGQLENNATTPFRDAHLKNRIITIDKTWLTDDYIGFKEWLHETNPKQIFEWLQMSTWDIDFETSFWLVTKWDDPLHIIWSCSSGLNQVEQFKSGTNALKSWWNTPESPAEQAIFWTTLLCRSLREHCRRVWYNHVMPNTYFERYGIEAQNHFLELALAAANHIPGRAAIKNFLDESYKQVNTLWKVQNEHLVDEPITAISPTINATAQIFLSYSHNDIKIVSKLAADLKQSGIELWVDSESINPGTVFTKAINDGIAEAQGAILILSNNSKNSNWCQEEWEITYKRSVEDSSFILVPILLETFAMPPWLKIRNWIDLTQTDNYEVALIEIFKYLNRQKL